MKSLHFLFLLLTAGLFAQKPEYSTLLIPPQMKENANAVVRFEHIDIAINSRTSVTITTYRAVTVLNKKGMDEVDASETRNVKFISAVIYDSAGSEIKRIKRKDFREVSVSEGAMISDDKMVYLDYTPTQYPFTIVYESEVADANTAFLPVWNPVSQPLLSVEKSEVTVTFPSDLGFKYKEKNFQRQTITKEEKPNSISFSATTLPAQKEEQYSPSFSSLVPYVLFGLNKFNLEGVQGEADSWEKFSAWRYNDLLSGTDELSPETQAKIKELVGSETDPLKKAALVYRYVQEKTRYVSIQLGIGGWRPMKAKDVDRLGYGDCKALTNYTRALLNVVGVQSYYAVIYGDTHQRDMESDFVSMQGNHIILAIPDGDKMKWLECTSQTLPFGFEGEFTDDRLALLVKPDGGQLMRTQSYKNTDNTQITNGNYAIDGSGNASGRLEIKSKGLQYESKLDLENKSHEDLISFYKQSFNVNNLQLKNIAVANDKEKVEFTENLSVDVTTYATASGNRLMFSANAFNQYSSVPQRYRSRNNPFEIPRGFYDQDEITITLPEGFSLEAKPENIEFSDVYGQYKAEYSIVDTGHLKYKRTLLISRGSYPAADYEKFRKFREQIAKADNAKCVLVKS